MLEQWLDAVCAEAGWPRPAQDEHGAYRFRFQDGTWVRVSSPDGRILRLSTELGRLASGHAGDELLRKIGQASLARAGMDTGIVSLDQRRGMLCYDAHHSLGAMRSSEMTGVLQHFLDEMNFWWELCR